MANEGAAKDKDTAIQAEFLAGSIAKGHLSEEFLDAESIRRGFALALGTDPNIGTSQSSCHFARALIESGVIRLNRS